MKILINKEVNWKSKESHYFFNPKNLSKQNYFKFLPKEEGRIYIMSSGNKKIVKLTKKAFLISAQSVNNHLNVTSKDRFLDLLPFFHVASLSARARSFCGGFSYFRDSDIWNPKEAKDKLESKGITITSLVPTQVYDLVKEGLKAPFCLRVVVVGGGKLDVELYKKAVDLQWPLLPSYGLTEMASQVATAPLSSLRKKEFPRLKILPHVRIKNISDTIELQSLSLLEDYLDISTQKWKDPKDKEGWFKTEDRGKQIDKYLEIYGRGNEQVKILGELVDVNVLSNVLKSFFEEGELVATPCKRKGYQIDLITTSTDFIKIKKTIGQFNQKVLPFEKIHNTYLVKNIFTGTLFKIKQELLRKQIGF